MWRTCEGLHFGLCQGSSSHSTKLFKAYIYKIMLQGRQMTVFEAEVFLIQLLIISYSLLLKL